MKKILVWNDKDTKTGLPAEEVNKEIVSIIKDSFETELKSLDEGITENTFKGYDAVIVYGGDQLRKYCEDKSLVAPLVSYVAAGGGLLVLHEGIQMAELTELGNVLGGKGSKFEEPQEITYVVPYVDPLGRSQGQVDHVIDDGVGEFTVVDRKGWFCVDLFAPFDQILRFKCEDYFFGCTCGWSQKYCLGRSAYITPGYSAEIFRNVEYRKMIMNAVKWVTGEISQPESDYEKFPYLG